MIENTFDEDEEMSREIKDMDFGKKASAYDESWGTISSRFYRLLLGQMELKPGAKVLDVGCGTGALLRRIADACPIIGFGIDMSENMIEEAKRKCPEMDMQISRCEETQFEDNTFDVVTTCMAYHHFSDRAGFAKEAARILKPGGCLYIVDPRFPFIIRKVMNAFFKMIRVAGAFFTPEEVYGDFAVFGFKPGGFQREGYAQVVKMILVSNSLQATNTG